MKSIAASKLYLLIALSTSILIVVLGFIEVRGLAKNIREQSANQQGIVLVKSLSASLQNDLLASNLYLASDRAHSFFNADSLKWMCFQVSQANQPAKNILEIGKNEICNNREAKLLSETIYFDSEGKVPAYLLTLKLDLASYPIGINSSAITFPLGALALALLSVLFISLLTGRIFSKIDFLIRTEGSYLPTLGPGFTLDELTKFRDLLQDLRSKRHELAETRVNQERSLAAQEIANQVSHDIRSPLGALNIALASIRDISGERKALIGNAIDRINNIANDLLRVNAGTPKLNFFVDASLQGLNNCVAAVVAEKRLQFEQFNGVQIEMELDPRQLPTTFAFDPSDLSRITSNLINNSIESFEDKLGSVSIHTTVQDDYFLLSIKDNGRGISKENLTHLGKMGFSFGKNSGESGAGLGVYHAKKTVEASGGQLQIQSTLGLGTEIRILLQSKSQERV